MTELEDFETVSHEPVKSCAEAAEARGLEEEQVVKSLIVESSGDEYHVLLPGDRTLSEKKFDPSSNVKMVSPERSFELTGQESGTVNPFSSDLPHIADERIFENETVSFTTGEATSGYVMSSSDLRNALEQADFEFGIEDIVVSEERDYRELEKTLPEEDARFVVNHGLRRTLSEVEASPGHAVEAMKKLRREDAEFDADTVVELIERSENDTHMQKLAEEYASSGEFPEEKEFDLDEVVKDVIEGNPEAVEDYRSGTGSALNYLLGRVMQRTGGKADGNSARNRLEERL